MATKPPMTVDIRNRLITTDVPSNGDALIYDASGNVWKPGPASGSPSGSAGGDLAGTYPNPTVARIRGVEVDTAAPSDGDALIYSSTAGRYVPAPPSGSGGLPTPDRVGQMAWWDGSVWRAGDSLPTPGTPHPDDDEFEGGSLDSAWTRTANYSSAGIDYERSDSGSSWWDSYNSDRKSWWLLQDAPMVPGAGAIKPHAFDTNEAIYVRFRADRRPGSTSDGARVDVFFTNSTQTDRVSFWLTHNVNSTSFGARIYETRSSGSAATGATINDATQYQYACIQKLGSMFVLWMSVEGVHWKRMLSFTPNGSVSNYDHVLIQIVNSTSSPVNLVGGFDFIRFRPGITQGVP